MIEAIQRDAESEVNLESWRVAIFIKRLREAESKATSLKPVPATLHVIFCTILSIHHLYQVAVWTFCMWSNSAMSAASARNALMVARPRTDEARCEKRGERETPSRRCTDRDVAT